ncbi:ABC transporter permease [Variovorax paradoxus]|jgi:peptide/nickel transport system permease protein|uniref:ABC transporter permease n=1 Tax=Variovorax paradoxus TaxID=34073 RepID=UPI00035EC400|nr:ABC transporter permease [Variovorax paradoxus]
MNSYLRLFLRHRSGVMGLAIIALVFVIALGAGFAFPSGPWDMVNAPFTPPFSDGSLLGTDMLGRDIAAGVAHGARMSLLLGVVSTVVALVIGTTIGAFAGYFGGQVDNLLMGLTEIFQTIPSFLLAVVLVATFKPSVATIVWTIAIVSWPPLARLVRAEFLTLKQREFVQAAALSGQSNMRIIFSQVLPNSLSPIIVSASLMTASAILLESGLSFLGLGDPNVMSWGFIIGASRSVMADAWWMSAFPGFAIMLTVLALNLIGEALTDVMNPKLSQARGK